MSELLVPRVLWAQRKDIVYLTFEVFEVKEEKVEINDNTVNFSGTRSSDGAKFAVSLELFSGVDAENSKIRVGHRDVALVLKKKEEGPFWPRLLKTTQKMHFIQTDFSKWADEDDEEDQHQEMPGMGDFSNFDMSQFAGGANNFGMNNFDDMGDDDAAADFSDEEESADCEDENCSHDHGAKISGLTKDNKSFDA